jgi:hypothetical protein
MAKGQSRPRTPTGGGESRSGKKICFSLRVRVRVPPSAPMRSEIYLAKVGGEGSNPFAPLQVSSIIATDEEEAAAVRPFSFEAVVSTERKAFCPRPQPASRRTTPSVSPMSRRSKSRVVQDSRCSSSYDAGLVSLRAALREQPNAESDRAPSTAAAAVIQGHSIRSATVDLTASTSSIRSRLLRLCQPVLFDLSL